MRQINYIKTLVVLGVMIILSSCGGGTCANCAAGSRISTNAITIDNAGTVPVIGNSTTTSIIHVHNNSDVSITGISYSASTNVTNSNTKNSSKNSSLNLLKPNLTNTSFLDPNSVKQCATIPAHQSCPLTFTTPLLSDYASQGSALITLNYSVNNKPANFSQTLSFKQIDNSKLGVYFQSGVNVSGFGYDVGYGTVYLYGGGNNSLYNVNKLSSNKSGIQIVNGNINNQQIQSNFIQAVEVAAPVNNTGITAQLSILTTDSQTQTQYTDSANVVTDPANDGGILVYGQVPVINSGVSDPKGILYITNAGNQAVTLGSIAPTTGISNVSGCTGSLDIGGSCTINFSVTQSGGTGTITVNYTGGTSGAAGNSVAAPITWFNGVGGAMVNMQYTTPISFLAATGQPHQEVVTVTNIGGYDITNITLPDPQSFGSATAATSSNTCATLKIGASCQFTLNINDDTIEQNQQIIFGFTGD